MGTCRTQETRDQFRNPGTIAVTLRALALKLVAFTLSHLDTRSPPGRSTSQAAHAPVFPYIAKSSPQALSRLSLHPRLCFFGDSRSPIGTLIGDGLPPHPIYKPFFSSARAPGLPGSVDRGVFAALCGCSFAPNRVTGGALVGLDGTTSSSPDQKMASENSSIPLGLHSTYFRNPKGCVWIDRRPVAGQWAGAGNLRGVVQRSSPVLPPCCPHR